MKNLVEFILKGLAKERKLIAVAESCTGGLISTLLTRNPGSSRYFTLGVITYSNQSKIKVLKIPPSLIKSKGAVSRETALSMAKSVRKISASDFGIGVTGIAGPLGGTAVKPVGTVFIAVAGRKNLICKKFFFKGNRAQIRTAAARQSLKLLQSRL